MPVEAATYIHDLNAADPTHTDGLNQMDSHLRLIKTVLQNQFPNLGDAAVTGTAAQLNQATGSNGAAGVLEVAANGAAGARITLDGVSGAGRVDFVNSATTGNGGSLAIVVYDATNTTPTTALSIDSAGDVTIAGWVTAAIIKQTGNALLPTGCILQWSGSLASVPAGWHLCDGTTGTPDLRDKFIVGAGLSYAVAQTGGQVTYNAVTDSQGTHSHTGQTVASSALAMTASTDVQGAHSHGGATASTALDITMIPPHNHTVPAGFSTGSNQAFSFGSATITGPVGTDNAGSGAGHSHAISTDGNHAHNVSVSNVPAHVHGISNDGSHAHNATVTTLPPYYALAYIMKL